MGRQIEVPLTSNTAEQDVSGSESLINVFPRKSTGGKYPFNLVNTPGLAFFSELPTLPVLGLHQNKGRLFAVTPSKFYEVFIDGRYQELGDVNLSGNIVMQDNGIQVVAVDGKRAYYYDVNTTVVSEITDPAFYPSSSVDYQDGYFIFNRTGTGQFFLSELLSVFFDPLDFGTAEGQPDELVRILSDHRELYLFGTETTEVWYNSGADDLTFERNQGVFIEKGCGARYTVAKQDNTIFFVGSDLIVYGMNGYDPVRISDHIVERTLKDIDLSDAFAYTHQDEGHLFYVLTIPKANITWCFDTNTGAWHIRKSYHFGRHQSNCSAFFKNKTLVGDFQNGRIYQFSTNYYKDDQDPIVREFTLPTINSGRDFMTIDSFELDMSSGVGLINGYGSDPKAVLIVSKDGGKTWSNDKIMTIGKVGKYLTRVKRNRFGVGRQFIFRVKISAPVPIDIGGAFIEVR